MEEQLQKTSRFNLEKIFEYCLLALIFLAPIFFIPSVYISLFPAKIAFIVSASVIFWVAFLIWILSGQSFAIPKSKFLIPVVLLPVIAIISSSFSGAFIKSSVGYVLELGTAGSLFIIAALFFMAMLAVRGKSEVGIKAFYAILLSATVVIAHLLVRVFLAASLPVAVASRIPNFLVGTATDTAIFLGVVVIASISALNFLPIGKKLFIYISAIILLSMIFISAVGLSPIIATVGLFALIYFVYTYSWSAGDRSVNKKVSLPSLIVLAISVIFFLSNGILSGYLSSSLKLNTLEVRPNFSSTMNIVSSALEQNALLGAGPNMFKELWDLYKPADINLTQFWSYDFTFGFGFVPTLVAMTGLLGGLVLLAFFALFIVYGFKALFSPVVDPKIRYASSASFFTSLFLWVMCFIYVPNISIIALAFIFTGMFAATFISQGVSQAININIFRNPRTNFISVFLIVVILIFSIVGGYFVWERVAATYLYQKGNTAKAAALVRSDIYSRGLSQSAFAEIQSIAGSVSSVNDLNDNQKTAIQNAIANSINYSKEAIAWNSKDYQNWFILGQIYEVLAQNGIGGALEEAKNSYTEAQARNPLNPSIELAFARLAAFSQNLDEAVVHTNKAIQMKTNYTDAYYVLAQLEVAANNIPKAIESVEATTFIEPQNASLYFQLGLLKYNNGDYSGAAKAFTQAVSIVPDYANAKYFLGLSYYKMGEKDKSIAQFEELEKTNPDNKEIKLIISNLESGKDPIYDQKSGSPQSRKELPVEENQ